MKIDFSLRLLANEYTKNRKGANKENLVEQATSNRVLVRPWSLWCRLAHKAVVSPRIAVSLYTQNSCNHVIMLILFIFDGIFCASYLSRIS